MRKTVLLLLIPMFAMASSFSGNVSFVSFQCFNFIVFLVALMFIAYKKIPGFLREKQQQFLLDRREANELEVSNRQICESLKKDIEELNKKENNIEERVNLALKNQEVKWTKQSAQHSEILKQELIREINRKKIQQVQLLKNKILSLSLKAVEAQFTKSNFKQTTNILEQHILKQLEKI